MDIRKYLRENGPCLSSTIKDELIKEGLKDEAARQQISRTRGGVYRLNEIKFHRRECFLYLKEQDKNDLFYTNLIHAFNTTKSIHKCIVTGLNNFGGCVPIDKLRVLSGCPKARKKKKTFDQAIHELQKIGLIKIANEWCYLHEDIFSTDKIFSESRVIIYQNEFLREILIQWLKNNSFVSYDAVSINDDFCSFYWDIKAPSYLLPFVAKKQKLGFVVADIIPHYDINDNDVDYFIRKVESCFIGRNTVPFIPILLGYRFSQSTWNLLKNKNILATTVSNFFGEETEKLLTNIVALLKEKSIKETDSLDKIESILKAVSKIEGPTNNFRGQFFELIVGHIAIKTHANGLLTVNKKIAKDSGRAEIDILMITSNEIIVYECKGRKPHQLISGDEIIEWQRKVSFIYNYFICDPENTNRRVNFNFWTTSDFSNEANIEFERIKHKKYSIQKKNGKEVIDFSKKLNLEAICGILKEYFIK